MEVGNTVLCQQADEVQAAEWELAGRRGEDGTALLRSVRILEGKASGSDAPVVIIEGLKLGEVAIE